MTELWPGFVSVFGVLAWGDLFEWFHFYVGVLLSNSPYIDRLVQDCSISSVLATEILQYFTKLSTWSIFIRYIFFLTRYVPKLKYLLLSTNKFIWWHIRVRDPVHKLISSAIIHSHVQPIQTFVGESWQCNITTDTLQDCFTRTGATPRKQPEWYWEKNYT